MFHLSRRYTQLYPHLLHHHSDVKLAAVRCQQLRQRLCTGSRLERHGPDATAGRAGDLREREKEGGSKKEQEAAASLGDGRALFALAGGGAGKSHCRSQGGLALPTTGFPAARRDPGREKDSRGRPGDGPGGLSGPDEPIARPAWKQSRLCTHYACATAIGRTCRRLRRTSNHGIAQPLTAYRAAATPSRMARRCCAAGAASAPPPPIRGHAGSTWPSVPRRRPAGPDREPAQGPHEA